MAIAGGGKTHGVWVILCVICLGREKSSDSRRKVYR